MWGKAHNVVAAQETTLGTLLGGQFQYQVPLYQRTYSWGKDQLEKLWEDVSQLAEDRLTRPGLTHFMGSLVLAPSPAMNPGSSISDWLVIDGQQRLTTVSLFLIAIRDHLAQHDPDARDRINQQYLVNKWNRDRYTKLQPTQADRAAYLACVDSTAHAGGADNLGAAYRFFMAKLASLDDQEDPRATIARLETALMSGLSLVSVTAGQGDNAHRIFESLNNTGLKLTQGDLLRNYLFMRLPTRGETVYQSLWLPLQQSLTPDDLETLFWLDLVQRDSRVKRTETYTEQSKLLSKLDSEQGIEQVVARFSRLGALFTTILDPAREQHPSVRMRLTRLQAWGSTTAYPVLLYLLDLRAQAMATADEIAQAMLYLESFIVRRLIIGRATTNLNRILADLVGDIRDETGPVDEAVRAYLSAGRKYYASDAEIIAATKSIPFYLNGRAGQRKLVLQWIEESYGRKESVDATNLTIEHVLPQSPTPEWRAELANDLGADEAFDDVHESLVHTLGNLTLTGYNPTLSNSPFRAKRQLLAKSGLAMNQEIAGRPRWDRPAILTRALALAERIISIWPSPLTVSATPVDAAWDVATRALAELPAGAWTTYGDIAALIGTHPIAVGARLANHPMPNAHRVLQADGRISDNFRWSDGRTDPSPRALLESEGVIFDDHGRADPQQRLRVEDLAKLADLTVDDLPESVPELPYEDAFLDRFTEQLATTHDTATVSAVARVLDAWSVLGGTLWLGRGSETSCFLMAREGRRPHNLWPVVLYPTGKCEVVFQHMAIRKPFDDVQLRQEFRERLNTIPGVDLPAAKLELRPSFPLNLLTDAEALATFIGALSWFYKQATAYTD
jgi:alkylated DNA nucleotide flippase Atl1